MNPNNDKSISMEGYKEGMRGVDREDNPMEVPAQRKSWVEEARETFGFQSSTSTDSASQRMNQEAKNMGQEAKNMGQQAESKMQSALDDMKQTMDSTQTGAKAHSRGSEIMDDINKETMRKDIGGSQLFGSPKGSKVEGSAGQGFLTKYANESAPGENTA